MTDRRSMKLDDSIAAEALLAAAVRGPSPRA